MALTPSNMLALGTALPSFELPDVVSGQLLNSEDMLKDHGVLIMVICNHCPYVKHVQEQMVSLANEYLDKGVGVVAISPNDVEAYPEDSPEEMREVAKRWNFHFPYLYDESQDTARALGAACTPEFYLFNNAKELVYRGQMDNSRPGNMEPNDGKDLRVAMDDLIAGNPIGANQIPSVGCNIKWK